MSDSSSRDKSHADSFSQTQTLSRPSTTGAPRYEPVQESKHSDSNWEGPNFHAANDDLTALLDQLAPKPFVAAAEPFSPIKEIQSLRESLRSRRLRFPAALQEICVTVARITSASGAAIGITEGNQIICRASWGNAPDLGAQVNQSSGLTGACVRSAAVTYCRDSENDTRVNAKACRHLQMRSMVVVPLLRNGRVDGLIEALTPEPDAFSSSHIEFLKLIANLVLELPSNDALSNSASATASGSQIHKGLPELTNQAPAAANTSIHSSKATTAPEALEPQPTVFAEIFTEPTKVATESVNLPRKQVAEVRTSERYSEAPAKKPSTSLAVETTPKTNLILVGIAAGVLLAAGIGWIAFRPTHTAPATGQAIAANQTPAPVPTPAPAETTQPASAVESQSTTVTSKTTHVETPAIEAVKKTSEEPKRPQAEAVSEEPSIPVRVLRPSTSSETQGTPSPIAPPSTVAVLPQGTVAALNLPSANSTNVSLAPVQRSAVSSGGRLIRRVEPTYPEIGRVAHLEGVVVLRLQISKEGAVKDIKVISGVPALAAAATDAVRKWQYEPYKQNGVPQEMDSTVSIRFNLPRR